MLAQLEVNRNFTVSTCVLHITKVCIMLFRSYACSVNISEYLFSKTIIVDNSNVQGCVKICAVGK